jgi:hypothetical protein
VVVYVTNRPELNTLHVSAWLHYSASSVLYGASSTDALQELKVVNSSIELHVVVFVHSVFSL